MKQRNFLQVLLICAAMIFSCAAPAHAADTQNEYICLENMACELVDPSSLKCWEASIQAQTEGRIAGNVPAHSLCPISSPISLRTNDLITFNCSYSPLTASLDFGVITSNGIFYYINVKEGSINKPIRISQSGSYSVAVRNNSSQTVSVVGFVNY